MFSDEWSRVLFIYLFFPRDFFFSLHMFLLLLCVALYLVVLRDRCLEFSLFSFYFSCTRSLHYFFYCPVSVTNIGLLHSRELKDLELHRLYRICDLSVKHKHRTITVTSIRVSPTLLCRSYHHKVLLSHFKHTRKHDTRCVSEDNKFSFPHPSQRQHLPSMFIS